MKTHKLAIVCGVFVLVLAVGLPAQTETQVQFLAPAFDGFGGPHFKFSLLNGVPVMFGGGPSAGISLFPGSWLGGWLALTVGPGWAEVPDTGAGEPAGSGLLVIEPEAAVTVALGSSSAESGWAAPTGWRSPSSPWRGFDGGISAASARC